MQISHVLRLREYESATIGDRWDADQKIVANRDVAALESLQRRSTGRIFAIGRRSIKAQNYVGTVSVGARTIEVLPKTDQDTTETRRRLVEMLAIAGLLPYREADVVAQAGRSRTVLDAYMAIYLDHLTKEWRRGQIANYRKVDRNRNCFKGKLLFGEQIRRNLIHAERFYNRCDEFSADVPPSQLLKAGIQVCRRFASGQSIRRDALSLLMEFDDISDVRFEPADLPRITIDRQSARFDPLLRLAKQLILGQTPNQSGPDETFSLLFDMNAVFEAYIAGLMRQLVCPPRNEVKSPVRGRHLLVRGTTGRFNLIPDIGIYSGRKPLCLIDTKWKLLNPTSTHQGVNQADMYQMYAYAKEYRCPLVILLFPKLGTLDSRVASYRIPPGDATSARIEVCAVDITKPPRAVASDLRELLGVFLLGELPAFA